MDNVRPGLSIRTKLAAALIVTALASVGIAAAVATRLIRQSSDRAALEELNRQARSIVAEGGLFGKEPQRQTRFLQRALNLSEATLYEISPDGSLAVLSGAPKVELTQDEVRSLAGGTAVQGRSPAGPGEILFVAQPFQGRRQLVVVLEREARAGPDALRARNRIFASALVAAIAAALASLYLSRRIANPLRELAAAASDVAKGDFSRRVDVKSGDEIGVVAASFNSMAKDLGDADRRQREFFLSISHELRTPLTAIQGYAEAIEDGIAGGDKRKEAANVIVGESRRLARLVSDLLDLGRIDTARFTVGKEEFALAPVIVQVQKSFARQAAEAGVSIEIETGEEIVVADQDRLTQVLTNLVENALRYTPSGGRITVLSAGEGGTGGVAAARRHDEGAPEAANPPNQTGPSCVIEVADDGPGFADEDLGHAFEREFLWGKYKGLRNVGTGLGLAITKELVTAMGGSVSAANAPGGGAKFRVTLPAA